MADLLKKEKEYYQLNEEIEKKTKKIIQEVNYVMTQKSAETNYLLENDFSNRRKSIETFNLEECAALNIPDSVNVIGSKGLTHFLKAKIKTLQNDLKQANLDDKAKDEELKKTQKDNLKLMEGKEKWLQLATTNKNQITKLESQLSSLQSKMQSKENENSALKKELEKLQRELKSACLTISNVESKFSRSVEECEKQKIAVITCKQELKDLRENSKVQVQELSSNFKRVEKQKMEILNGFKKQLILIDNLKKQKAHIETYKLTEKSEADFMKILDWKIDN